MCSQPSALDDLRGALGVAVVAFHQRIAADADLALLADGQRFAGLRGGDFDLGLRHGAAHGFDANLNGVVGVAHGDNGRGLGLAVGDDQLAAVHLVRGRAS